MNIVEELKNKLSKRGLNFTNSVIGLFEDDSIAGIRIETEQLVENLDTKDYVYFTEIFINKGYHLYVVDTGGLVISVDQRPAFEGSEFKGDLK